MDDPQDKEVVFALDIEDAIRKLVQIRPADRLEEDREAFGMSTDEVEATVQLALEREVQARGLVCIPGLSLS
jgi:hypothetical protein